MRTLYREHKYYCGGYLDVQIYPVYKKQGGRSKKAKPTSEVQAKLNADNAARHLTRLLNKNFTPRDLALHLTYLPENLPANDEQAKKDVQNFIRRVKRYYKKLEISDFKYIWVTEKSSKGRYHHHVVFTGGGDRTEIEKIWGKGYANSKALQFGEKGLEGLAHYITKKPIFYKRWSGSRNLKKPLERTNDYKISGKQAAKFKNSGSGKHEFESMYKGYILSDFAAKFNNVNNGIYIYAQLRKIQDSKHKQKE